MKYKDLSLKNLQCHQGIYQNLKDFYLSLNNGRLIKADATSGKEENIFKLSNSNILRPSIISDKMYLLKNNAIIKTN